MIIRQARIRQARMGDCAGICDIANAVIRAPAITFATAERGEAAIAADIALRWAAFQVAEEEGRVLGFATFGPFRTGPGYDRTRELTIQLACDARRRGLGRALLQALEQVAVAQGVHVLVAGISGGNPGAIAFHAACGYGQVGRLPQVGFKAGQWLDLVLMQKTLPDAQATADSAGTVG